MLCPSQSHTAPDRELAPRSPSTWMQTPSTRRTVHAPVPPRFAIARFGCAGGPPAPGKLITLTIDAEPRCASTETRSQPPARYSKGFALIASLIILAMLALLGVASMTATTTEVQISASIEDVARSFHAAEAGISAAQAAIFSDDSLLAFTSGTRQFDFSAMSPNPLANLADNTPTAGHNDLPTVTALISGDLEGKCERSEFASSDDLLGCGAFDVVSTHASANADTARGGVTTTLRLGISRQIIATD